MPRINASNDFFIRTSDPRHEARVQEVMQRIHDNGHTYKGTYEGWYCPRCADFKTEQEIGPGNTCPIHQIPLDREQEENWFFRLLDLPGAARAALRRATRLRHARASAATRRAAFITGGLKTSRSAARKRKLTWGVEVPWDDEHVFYVWFDALLNYYTALGFARDGEDLTDTFWPATLHVIGKDILKFHAVFWPAMLMAADLPLPEHVFIHGYLLMRDASGAEHEDVQVARQRARPVRGDGPFGTDALRYYCFREVSFGQDGGVSTTTFGERYESELANDFGNLASRTLAMIGRYRDGVVPEVDVDPALGAGLRRACATRSASCSTAPRSPRRSSASGSACGGSTATSRSARRGSSPRTRRSAGELDTTLRSLAEGLRVVDRAAHALHPRDGGQAARRARRAGHHARPARRTAPTPGGARVEKLAAAVPEAADCEGRDRLPHPPRPRAGARGRAGGRGARGGRRADPHDRHRRPSRAAPRSPPPRPTTTVFAAIGHHPNEATGYDDAITDELRELAAHPRCLAIGETGPRRLPRLRAARRPGARVPRPHRARARARQAARHPHARGRGRHDRHAGRARRRASKSCCTASRCPTGSTSASTTAGGSRSPATSRTRRRATWPTPPSASRSTACWSRPTPRT